MRKTILYNTMDACRDNVFFESSSHGPGHVVEDNTDLPLLEPEVRFRKQDQYRHKSRMAASEVEANTKIRQHLLGRSGPTRGDYAPGDAETTGEQVKRSISRRVIGCAPQESAALKAVIFGFDMEQQRSSVRKNKFGWHHLLKNKCEKR